MKPSTKIRRRLAREQRRLEWEAARASFLLAGGHKQHIIPFHMDWRRGFERMEASIAMGSTAFTKHHTARGTNYGHYQTPQR